jgi:DNA-binding response OmpR family regulator
MEQHAPPPIPQARILVVEDEVMTRKAIVRALNLLGYRANAAGAGSEALEALRTLSYDVMLLDLRMPGIDGVEVMRRVRVSHPNLQVIVFTAYATVESAIEALRAGAVEYLLKPCSIPDIEAAIRRALERRQERLRREHLLEVMSGVLDALQAETDPERHAPPVQEERFLQYGPIALDLEKRLVIVQGAGEAGSGGESSSPDDSSSPPEPQRHHAELTANEQALLAYLMRHPETVHSPRQLAQGAMGYDLGGPEAGDIVRPHISRLRKKIEPDPARPRLIITVRGKGYMLSPS